MTDIDCGAQELVITFPGWESLMVGRRAVHLPYRAIRSVRVEPGWTSEILGMRAGLVVSGRRKLATFRHPSGTRRLVSMSRGRPLLRLGVDRSATGFDEILLSCDDARRVADRVLAAVAR